MSDGHRDSVNYRDSDKRTTTTTTFVERVIVSVDVWMDAPTLDRGTTDDEGREGDIQSHTLLDSDVQWCFIHWTNRCPPVDSELFRWPWSRVVISMWSLCRVSWHYIIDFALLFIANPSPFPPIVVSHCHNRRQSHALFAKDMTTFENLLLHLTDFVIMSNTSIADVWFFFHPRNESLRWRLENLSQKRERYQTSTENRHWRSCLQITSENVTCGTLVTTNFNEWTWKDVALRFLWFLFFHISVLSRVTDFSAFFIHQLIQILCITCNSRNHRTFAEDIRIDITIYSSESLNFHMLWDVQRDPKFYCISEKKRTTENHSLYVYPFQVLSLESFLTTPLPTVPDNHLDNFKSHRSVSFIIQFTLWLINQSHIACELVTFL